jgi:hypothetical protein
MEQTIAIIAAAHPHSVVHAADRVLNLTLDFVSLAVGLQLRVAGRLADRLFHRLGLRKLT